MHAILERLGIAEYAQRHIRALSGGQQQRVFLARAMMRDSKLLLLDEPTTGVDIATRDDVLHMLADLNRDGVTIVLTTHELNAVAAHLPYVVCMNRQLIAHGPPEDVFTPEILGRTYNAKMNIVVHDGVRFVAESPHLSQALRGDARWRWRSPLMGYLTDPLEYEFMRHALIAATLVGGLCGMIGVYVVLRRMSYIGHGMSHSVFGGAVVGYVLGWNFYLVAGGWGFISALLINQTTRRRQIGADAAIGIITTASFAFGVALISRARNFTRNFDAALFGNLLGISNQDLLLIAITTAVMIVVVLVLYKQLLFLTFDPEVAPTYGVPTQWIDVAFALILAATIIVSIKIMGVTLIAASLVIPPVIARLLTNSFARIIVLSDADRRVRGVHRRVHQLLPGPGNGRDDRAAVGCALRRRDDVQCRAAVPSARGRRALARAPLGHHRAAAGHGDPLAPQR